MVISFVPSSPIFLVGVSKGVQSGEIKVRVIGKHIGSSESVLEFLKQRMLTVERGGLKPHRPVIGKIRKDEDSLCYYDGPRRVGLGWVVVGSVGDC